MEITLEHLISGKPLEFTDKKCVLTLPDGSSLTGIYDVLSRVDSEDKIALVYDTPFDKAKFINEVAEGERKRFVLIKGACDANS